MGRVWWAAGNRPIFFPVLFFLLGLVEGAGLALPPAWGLVGAAAALAGAAWAGPRPGALLLTLAASTLLGAACARAGLARGAPPPGVHLLEGEVETVTGTADGERLTLQVDRCDGQPVRFRASLSAAAASGLGAGQAVLLPAHLRALGTPANPGEWDRARPLERKGLVRTGWFDPRRAAVRSPQPAWRRWVEARQAALTRLVGQQLDDPDAGALVLTLAAGQRAALGEALEEDFARSGLAHVLSVSGLHVGVVALALFRLARWLLIHRPRSWNRRRDARALAAPLAVPLVWGYVLFTGWQAPAVRSAVMCSLVLLAWPAARRSDALNALAAALLLMTVAEPSAPFELSVQLSFTAVLAMVLLAPALRALLPEAPPPPEGASAWARRLAGWREAALETAAASLAVTAATAPLVLGAFGRLSLVGLLSNLVTLPLTGALTLACAGAAALSLLAPWAAVPAVWVAGGCARLFLWLTRAFAALPFAAATLPSPPAWLAAAWWLGLGAALLAEGRWQWAGLLAPAAAAWLLWAPAPPGLEVTFLAVGQGDAAVLRSRGHLAVVDGGGVPGGADPGERVVVPFLAALGARRLDLVALSHAHPDHALGLTAVLEAFPADRVWLPEGAGEGELVEGLVEAAGEAPVEALRAGDRSLALGEALVEVLGPPADARELQTENDRSLVLRVRHGRVVFLLPGDVEAAGERFLEPGAVTVLKAPHHGSDTSSTPGLLEQARPRFVVFCVGKDNRFGFPKGPVVERYQALGSRCYRTDLDGAVTFRSDGEEVTVETFGPRRLLELDGP